MKQRFREKLAIVTCLALALSVFNPLTSQAAVKAPSSAVGYLASSGEYAYGNISFTVKGLKASEQIKLSSIKSSDTDVADISSINGSYSFDSSRVKDNYCDITLSATKAGKTTISYKVGKSTKKTQVTVKNYVNPVKKITLTGVNGGDDFSALTKESSSVYSSSDSGNTFTVKETEDPVLSITPESGWYIRSVNSYLGGEMVESYHKVEGKEYSGAQKFTLYKLFSDAQNLNIEFVNKDGGTIRVSYQFISY